MIILEADALLVDGALPQEAKRQLEQHYLPVYLVQRRWFAGKNSRRPAVKITNVFPTSAKVGPILWCFAPRETRLNPTSCR